MIQQMIHVPSRNTIIAPPPVPSSLHDVLNLDNGTTNHFCTVHWCIHVYMLNDISIIHHVYNNIEN